MVGSFSNLEENQYSYLPPQWKSIHPVFHISLLEAVNKSTIPNWHQEPPPPIIIEKEEEWEVSQILDSKLKRRMLWYLMEWKGFSQDSGRSTWEPAKSLNNFPELVKDSHSLYPAKPGPNCSRASLLWHLVGRGITKLWKIFSRLNTCGISTSNPSQQPQQDCTLSWCSGAHHSR
ncbi:hypothetical protein O181_068731 [Austropuccinia psidii MF-1]|uniref:Chromo domain-containing protein n=1 Tax=Austropuccinia psidii MF-1 TaxID=1389203 RepID=A0A9Q3I463_9BASI|nr:hypothetical protein [Austropuccinia psidii MF-1]